MHTKVRKSVPFGSVIVICALLFLVGFVAGTRKEEILSFLSPITGYKAQTDLDFSSVNELYNTLKNNYDGVLDTSVLITGAKKGMVDAAGDKYTVFMSREEAIEFEKDLSGDVGAGIGVEIADRQKGVTVLRALKDNPALIAGIKAGDIIFEVNGEDVVAKNSEEVSALIRGVAGTSVNLRVVRDGEILNFDITRQQINNPSVTLEYSNDIAVIKISRFDKDTGSLAKKVASEINEKGVNKIILDLRGNGGGYVSTAKDVLSLWLDNKKILTEKSLSSSTDMNSGKNMATLSGKQTVVLIDSSSASASEIVAGAMKDYKIATLVGETTYGKGSVQNVINLDGGEKLKVTIAKWYTPSGKNINEEGIHPDEEIILTAEDVNNNNDTQLKKALETLK